MKRLFVLLACLVLVIPSTVFALSDKDYVSFKKESPEFAKADQELGKAWKELQSIAPQNEKEYLLANQKEWITSMRDVIANNFIEYDKLDKVSAYTKATELRRDVIARYVNQLKNPDSVVKLKGRVNYSKNEAGACYNFNTEGEEYYLIQASEENEELLNLVEEYEDRVEPVVITGKIQWLTSFDKKTIQFFDDTESVDVEQVKSSTNLIGPKVKGFQLGMPITEAMENYQNLTGKQLSQDKNARICFYKDKVFGKIFEYSSGEQSVTAYTLDKADLKKIFNLPVLDQNFIDSYGIPELNYKEENNFLIDATIRYYEYIDKSGYTVKVFLDSNDNVSSIVMRTSEKYKETVFD